MLLSRGVWVSRGNSSESFSSGTVFGEERDEEERGGGEAGAEKGRAEAMEKIGAGGGGGNADFMILKTAKT